MEKGYWLASLAHQQCFPYKSFKFPQNSNCHKNSLFNVGSLKLGHFHIFEMPFSFLVYLFWTTTIFYDWQGHVTLSSKEPIAVSLYLNKLNPDIASTQRLGYILQICM